MVSPSQIKESVVLGEELLSKIAPHSMEYLEAAAKAAGGKFQDQIRSLSEPFVKALKDVNEGLTPAKDFWRSLSGETFDRRVKPSIFDELRSAKLRSRTLTPVDIFAHSKPYYRIQVDESVSATEASVQSDAFHTKVTLPSGLSRTEKKDTLLGAIFGQQALGREVVSRFDGTAEFLPKNYSPHNFVARAEPYTKNAVADALKGGAQYISRLSLHEQTPETSNVANALFKEFGAFDARSRLVAHRILDSVHADSPWSPKSLVEHAALEPTPGNLGAATNLTLFQLSPAHRGLGIELMGRKAEEQIAKELKALERRTGKLNDDQIADQIARHAREAPADDVRLAFSDYAQKKLEAEQRAVKSKNYYKPR
jgi:hypothetical protein